MLLYIASRSTRQGGPGEEYRCRQCGELVGLSADQVAVMDRPSRRVYVNPHGVQCEIVTLSGCLSFVPSSYSTTVHTWFAGYAWRPIGCGGCACHLGWRFEAVGPTAGPAYFFGLLTAQLSSIPIPASPLGS